MIWLASTVVAAAASAYAANSQSRASIASPGLRRSRETCELARLVEEHKAQMERTERETNRGNAVGTVLLVALLGTVCYGAAQLIGVVA